MTDAPDRIWVTGCQGCMQMAASAEPDSSSTEYVRADLVDGVENEWRKDWEELRTENARLKRKLDHIVGKTT
jgi:hypothetical protein